MNHSSSRYLEIFKKSSVRYFDASNDRCINLVDDIRSHEHAYVELEDFGLILLAKNKMIETQIMENAHEILLQVVELDRFIHSRDGTDSASYELQEIEIRERNVDFLYCSNEVNATWFACFEKVDGHWKFVGLG